MNYNPRNLIPASAAVLAVMAFMLLGCSPAQAQPPPVTTHNPERVRNLMLAIHGFTYDGLQAASTDVPAILRGFIDDPAERMTVRRQAVKALRHYPSEKNFAFIEGRLDSAPIGLRRLYVLTLAGFDATHHDRIVDMLGPLLADPDVGVRHATLVLCGRLKDGVRLRALMEDRLNVEPQAGVRRAINRVLGR